jgi:hypothetical protein
LGFAMPLNPIVKTCHVRSFLRQYKDPYYDALSRFVTAFSQVETTLLHALWRLAQLKSPYAQAVLSGVRIEGAMGFVNRIADAEKWPADKRADWQKLFTQIGLINRLRNDILHYGTMSFGSVRVVSNEAVAHVSDRVREIHVTPTILDKATKDLWDIFLFVTLLSTAPGEVYVSRKPQTILRGLKRKTWRYKQPRQANWAQMLDESHRSRRRPRRSSRR